MTRASLKLEAKTGPVTLVKNVKKKVVLMEVHALPDLVSAVPVRSKFLEKVFKPKIFFKLVTLVCGSVTAENSTYFESDSVPVPGNCGAKICKLNSNICQVSKIVSKSVQKN